MGSVDKCVDFECTWAVLIRVLTLSVCGQC